MSFCKKITMALRGKVSLPVLQYDDYHKGHEVCKHHKLPTACRQHNLCSKKNNLKPKSCWKYKFIQYVYVSRSNYIEINFDIITEEEHASKDK